MKRGQRAWTREEQLVNFARVKQLLAEGFPVAYVASELGVSIPTVYNYQKLTEPPASPNRTGRRSSAVVNSSERETSLFLRRDLVPLEIASLRDKLHAAFMRGDFDEFSRCSQELKTSVRALKLLVLPALPAPPIAQAAE